MPAVTRTLSKKVVTRLEGILGWPCELRALAWQRLNVVWNVTSWIVPLALASLKSASSYVKPALPVSWQLQALFLYWESFLQYSLLQGRWKPHV